MEKTTREIVPPAPKPDQITSTIKKDLATWVERIRGFSSRIQVITREDPNFRPDRWKNMVQEYCFGGLPEDYNRLLYGWPDDVDQIAFLARFDVSVRQDKQYYAMENHKLFCFGDIAFGLNYFEKLDTDNLPLGVDSAASLDNYTEDSFSWKHQFNLAKNKIREIEEKSVPK